MMQVSTSRSVRLAFLVALVAAAGCDQKSVEKRLWVGPERVSCGTAGPSDCLRVSEDPTSGWTLVHGEIKGLDREDGYSYEIRVRERRGTLAAAVVEGAELELIEVVAKTPASAPDATLAEEAGGDAADKATAAAGLEDKTWFLVSDASPQGADDSAADAKEEKENRTWIRFHGTRVTGLAGCNRYFGRYSAKADTIKITSVAATNRACESSVMALQKAHLETLQAARSFEIKGDVLELKTGDGRSIKFENRPPESARRVRG